MVAAGMLTAPEWQSLPISYQDYPKSAMRAGKSGATKIELVISPEGKVISCTVVINHGDEVFGKTFCAILSRKKLHPAMNAEGRPAYGMRTDAMTFFLPGTAAGKQVESFIFPPDVELTVAELPTGVAPDISVIVAVNEAGQGTACQVADADTSQNLGKAACSYLKGATLKVAKDGEGKAVNYVQKLKVRFVVES